MYNKGKHHGGTSHSKSGNYNGRNNNKSNEPLKPIHFCKYCRGQVWWETGVPHIGSVQSSDRPVLIISDDTMNSVSSCVIVLPMTSKHKFISESNIVLPFNEKSSIVLGDQPRTVPKENLKNSGQNRFCDSALFATCYFLLISIFHIIQLFQIFRNRCYQFLTILTHIIFAQQGKINRFTTFFFAAPLAYRFLTTRKSNRHHGCNTCKCQTSHYFLLHLQILFSSLLIHRFYALIIEVCNKKVKI